MFERILWWAALLSVLPLAWNLSDAIRGKRTRNVLNREAACHGRTGAILCFVLWGVSLGVALWLMRPGGYSGWHLLWVFPVVIVAATELASFLVTVRSQSPVRWGLAAIGVLVCGAAAGATWWQIDRFDRESAWVIYRLGLVPVPLVAITAILVVFGLVMSIKAFLRWEWSVDVRM